MSAGDNPDVAVVVKSVFKPATAPGNKSDGARKSTTSAAARFVPDTRTDARTPDAGGNVRSSNPPSPPSTSAVNIATSCPDAPTGGTGAATKA